LHYQRDWKVLGGSGAISITDASTIIGGSSLSFTQAINVAGTRVADVARVDFLPELFSIQP